MKARVGEKQCVKALLWNNPRVPYLVRLERHELEEVKSTVRQKKSGTGTPYLSPDLM